MGRREELWLGRWRFLQDDEYFKLGTDSVLLANFPSLSRCARACDLGCGTGVVGLLLASRDTQLRVDGLEILPGAAAIAQENVSLNRLDDRMRIFCGDMRDPKQLPDRDAYDLVVCNPPYFLQGTGKRASKEMVCDAREDRECSIEDVCVAASRVLKHKGKLCVVFRPERMIDLLCAMRNNKIEPKRIRFVRHKVSGPITVVLVEGRYYAGKGLVFEPDLIMENEDGTPTPEMIEIYRRQE